MVDANIHGFLDRRKQARSDPRTPSRALSLAHLTILRAAPPELVSAAARAGFGAVGIRVRPAADEPAYPMLGDTPMLRETQARLAATGLRVLDVEVLRLRPESRHDDALRVLDAGWRLGARGVLVIANDSEESRLVERLGAICAAAAERNMRACLEFMIFSAVKTLADAVRVIGRVAHPAAAILVDALHLQRSGATPAAIAALPSAWLPYAQLCDGPLMAARPTEDFARTEARTGRRLPGDGEFPLRELIAALPADAELAVEAPVPELAGESPDIVARLAYAALTRLLASDTPR